MAYYTAANYWTNGVTYPRDTVRKPYPRFTRDLSWLTTSIVPTVFIVGCVQISDALRWSVGTTDRSRFTLCVADSSLWSVCVVDSVVTTLSTEDAARYGLSTSTKGCP